MEAVLFYLGKVTLASGVMYLYYQLFLKDKTFHHYNRFYLLGILLVSLLLPLVKVSAFTIDVNSDVYILMDRLKQAHPKTNSQEVNYLSFFALGAGWVSVFLLARFSLGIFKISRFKKRFPREAFEGIRFYQTDLDNAPFSYFKNLFWKNSIQVSSEPGKQILKHEMVHIEQKHTWDKIFIEIIKSVFWINPFFYLIKKEIHLIHEYLADKKTVKQSDTKAFAQMLLASHFSGNSLPVTSPLLSANLKKRLKMLKTPKTTFSYARRIFALPLLFVIAFACVVNAQNRKIKAGDIEMARAVNEAKKDKVTTRRGIAANTHNGRPALSKKAKRSVRKLKQKEAEIARLGNQIREKSEALKTLALDAGAFSEKMQEMTLLSEKISAIANADNFKNHVEVLRANALNHDRATLSREDLERIKEDAARAKEAGAAAQETADRIRKQAALTRKQAERIREQVKSN